MTENKRLLTPEQFHKLHEDFFGKGSGTCCEIDDSDLCYRVALDQDAKTRSATLREVMRWFERSFSATDYHSPEAGKGLVNSIDVEDWQRFRDSVERGEMPEG